MLGDQLGTISCILASYIILVQKLATYSRNFLCMTAEFKVVNNVGRYDLLLSICEDNFHVKISPSNNDLIMSVLKWFGIINVAHIKHFTLSN